MTRTPPENRRRLTGGAQSRKRGSQGTRLLEQDARQIALSHDVWPATSTMCPPLAMRASLRSPQERQRAGIRHGSAQTHVTHHFKALGTRDTQRHEHTCTRLKAQVVTYIRTHTHTRTEPAEHLHESDIVKDFERQNAPPCKAEH